MGISEFTIHNVLRTYTRQDRLGKIQRMRSKGAPKASVGDRVSLSPTGQKAQWVGQLAAEVVDRREPDLENENRSTKIRSTKEEILQRHRDEVGNDRVSPRAFEASLRSLYLG